MCDLLLCSDEKEMKWLLKHCGVNYIIATNNYAFYRRCQREKRNIAFLESNDAMPSEQTWGIIKQINNIIKEISGVKKALFYQIPYHIEGGQFLPTTIASLLLNLDLIDKVVTEYHIHSFFVVDNKANWVINESIFLYAQGRGLRCVILDENGEHKTCLFTLRDTIYNPDRRNENEILRKKELEVIKDKYRNQECKNREEEYSSIGLLYCAKNSTKHITWTKQHISVFGEKVKVISFYRSSDICELRRNGIDVDCLEEYFNKKTFRKNYLQFAHDRKIILEQLSTKLHITYIGIELSIFLNRKIQNYYYRDLIEVIFIDSCAKEYFRLHKYDLIRVWGNSNFWQTQVCYENTRDNEIGTDLFGVYEDGVILDKLFEPNQDIIGFFLCSSVAIKNFYINKRYQGQAYITFDIRHGKDFYNKYTNYVIKKKDNKFRIAILPSNVEAGFNTVYNYYNKYFYIVNRLLSMDCNIIFKNHSRMDEYIDIEIKECFKNHENIIFKDKDDGCYQILTECDLVITDISTIVFDAACEQKPVFCIVDEQEHRRIERLEEGFQIYQSTEKLCQDIEAMVRQKYEASEIIEKQNMYMKEMLGSYDEVAEEKVRKILRYRVQLKRKDIKLNE